MSDLRRRAGSFVPSSITLSGGAIAPPSSFAYPLASVQTVLTARLPPPAQAAVTTATPRVWGRFGDLHTHNGVRASYLEPEPRRDSVTTRVWVFAMDALCVGLILIVMSPLYVWVRLNTNRLPGLAALSLGVACCAFFIWGLAGRLLGLEDTLEDFVRRTMLARAEFDPQCKLRSVRRTPSYDSSDGQTPGAQRHLVSNRQRPSASYGETLWRGIDDMHRFLPLAARALGRGQGDRAMRRNPKVNPTVLRRLIAAQRKRQLFQRPSDRTGRHGRQRVLDTGHAESPPPDGVDPSSTLRK